jgi:hypothetical protein
MREAAVMIATEERSSATKHWFWYEREENRF